MTASTLTTVAVFAPIALVGGFVGQLFAPFAITVTVALLASLLVSLTVIPVLAYWFLRPAGGGADAEAVRARRRGEGAAQPAAAGYLPVIRFATTPAAGPPSLIGLVVLSARSRWRTRLETNFLDDSGQDTLTISQELPVGTSLAATDAAAKKVEAVLAGTRRRRVLPGDRRRRRVQPVRRRAAAASGASFYVGARRRTPTPSKVERPAARPSSAGSTGVGEVTVGGDGGTASTPTSSRSIVQADRPGGADRGHRAGPRARWPAPPASPT